jgi:apolipoprotein N-acyltransferase
MSAQLNAGTNALSRPDTGLALVPAANKPPQELLIGMGLASLSGVLLFVACPDFNIWPLALVAMVPAFFAIERASSTRRAMLFAWWVGLVGNAGGFYWIVGLLERFADLSLTASVPIFIIICSIMALRLLMFGWIVRALCRNFNLPLTLLAPLVMVSVELCIPLVFQYYLAFIMARQLHFIQIADLTGPLGVTALLMMVNGAVYDIVTNPRRRLITTLSSLLILFSVLAYGHLRIKRMNELRAGAPKIKVGIVQPNTASKSTDSGQGIFAYQQLALLQSKSAELEAEGADLIVWPESAYPQAISRQADGDWPEQHPSRIRRGFTVPLIFNAETFAPSTGTAGQRYNSALMLNPSGKFAARYNKNHLLMFGEYFPGVEMFPWLLKFAPAAADQYASGKDVAMLPFQTKDGREWRMGPMICLEDILPDYGRKLGALSPHLLVNLTNDSWFGDTSEPWQHLSLSVFRSIELRTELVRAVQTGVSAYVDTAGRIYAETYSASPDNNPRPADKLLKEVALIEGGHTVYATVGDIFGYSCSLATLFLWLVLPRLGRRRQIFKRRRAKITEGDSTFSPVHSQ